MPEWRKAPDWGSPRGGVVYRIAVKGGEAAGAQVERRRTAVECASKAPLYAHMRSDDAMRVYDPSATKRAVNLTLNSDLVRRARAEGLSLSAIAEEAVAAALARRSREKFDVEITEACRAHDAYLADYGSLGEAVRNQPDGDP